MALVVLLASFLSLAQTCPSEKVLPSLPVHDQDGVGSCASNTAALMMQHNLGLSESPSYLQLSLTTSGQEKADFYFNDDKGVRRIFNWGAHICEVIKTAKDDGYCNTSAFTLDAVGRADSRHQQGAFLNSLTEYLNSNRAALLGLRSKLSHPQERQRAIRNLAQRNFANAQTCRYPFNEFISRRALQRFKEVIRVKIQASTGPEKTKYQTMYNQTFNAQGEPTARALAFHQDFIRSQGTQLLGEEKSARLSLGTTSLPDESLFVVWWGNELKLSQARLQYPYRNMFQSDHAAYAPCRQEGSLVEDLRFVQTQAFCREPGQTSLPQNFLDQAQEILSQLQEYMTPAADPQAAMVNLISPSCAAQMPFTQGNRNLTCDDLSINNLSSARRATQRIYSELCRGKAVAISMCTGFFKATGPVNSNYCEDDVPGVEGHGRHALTLIGYRTIGEKKQIKIQNSWGPTCPFLQNTANAVPVALAQKVECEMQDGRPTGRFWVDEDLLINNSYQLSVMP